MAHTSGITYTGVVAMASDRAIGLRQTIPWHLPQDMRLFKSLTMGHPILMGRKTWESLGRPLPGRQNIVLTRRSGYTADGACVIRDISDLADMELIDSEVMVIGGAQVYALMLPLLSKLWVSEVEGSYEADTYFPDFAQHFTSAALQQQFDGFRLVLYSR